MLPLARFLVRVGPRQLEDVGEEALGETMAAHDALGDGLPGVGERDRVPERHDVFALEATDHLGYSRARDLEPFGDARLDDVDVVFAKLVDGFAVLLDGGVPLAGAV